VLTDTDDVADLDVRDFFADSHSFTAVNRQKHPQLSALGHLGKGLKGYIHDLVPDDDRVLLTGEAKEHVS
jgi:hypothetical protein